MTTWLVYKVIPLSILLLTILITKTSTFSPHCLMSFVPARMITFHGILLVVSFRDVDDDRLVREDMSLRMLLLTISNTKTSTFSLTV